MLLDGTCLRQGPRAFSANDDMLDLLKESWASVQSELRGSAGAAAYEAWLADLRPVLLERSVVYLEAKSRMVRARAQKLFGPLLQEIPKRRRKSPSWRA